MAEGEAAVGSPGVGIGEELGEDMVMMIGVCQCLRGMKQIIQSIQLCISDGNLDRDDFAFILGYFGNKHHCFPIRIQGCPLQ